MKQWKINEKIAYEWVKKNLDSKAVLHGGSISNAPDITLSNGDIYEVKSVEAQCGQFTAKTAYKYKYSDDIQEYFLGIYGRDLEPKETFYLNNHPICKAWVKAYYKDIKKVKAFLVVEHGKVTEQSLEDYFNNHIFKCTYRFKKSGSESNIPEWAVKLLPKHWECINDGKKYYASNPNVFKEKVYGFNTRGKQKVISVEENNQIKILSGTCTPTFIFRVEEKK